MEVGHFHFRRFHCIARGSFWIKLFISLFTSVAESILYAVREGDAAVNIGSVRISLARVLHNGIRLILRHFSGTVPSRRRILKNHFNHGTVIMGTHKIKGVRISKMILTRFERDELLFGDIAALEA